MQFEIRNRYTESVQFTAEIDCAEDAPASVKTGLAVIWAARTGADLSGADLSKARLGEADLSGADLREADLREADLSGANLRWARLSGADLSGADLSGANPREADLSGARLSGANLSGADLSGADLSGANLREADLSGADLRGADLSVTDLRGARLSEADLSGANLSGANLRGAKDIPVIAAAQTIITPEGQIVGWKKCRNGIIVKLTIPAEARRSNAAGRKCRAEYADVSEVIGAEVGISTYDGMTKYRVGQRVTCDNWCEDRWQECAGGIHFFLTRAEAEAY